MKNKINNNNDYFKCFFSISVLITGTEFANKMETG